MENNKIQTLPLIQVSFAVNDINGIVNGIQNISDADREKINEAIKKVHDAIDVVNRHRQHFVNELYSLANSISRNN